MNRWQIIISKYKIKLTNGSTKRDQLLPTLISIREANTVLHNTAQASIYTLLS